MTAKNQLLRLLPLYPPFLGAGIRVKRLPDGWESSMRLSFPQPQLLRHPLRRQPVLDVRPLLRPHPRRAPGPGYVCWDKAATIRFLRPAAVACAPVRDSARAQRRDPAGCRQHGKTEPVFTAQVLDAQERVVAEVEKLL
jgi:hypothetical protein